MQLSCQQQQEKPDNEIQIIWWKFLINQRLYEYSLVAFNTGFGRCPPQNANIAGEINLPSANMQNSVCGVINFSSEKATQLNKNPTKPSK